MVDGDLRILNIHFIWKKVLIFRARTFRLNTTILTGLRCMTLALQQVGGHETNDVEGVPVIQTAHSLLFYILYTYKAFPG
jgi:hypothetical protein